MVISTPLGRLARIPDIRGIWPDEARDFTPWLAQPENLALLSEELGLGNDGLELEGVEQNVGPFRADILCRDTNSAEGDRVLIENQYGRTDHDHLGKLLTYGAGLRARTVVLIAENIREEHRAALDWLNDMSDDAHRFFGVTVELWHIGESPPAPRFNVKVAPNDWARQVKASVTAPALTPLKETYIRYWSALADFIEAQNTPLRPRKPLPQQWTGYSIGRANFELNANAVERDGRIAAELRIYGANAKAILKALEPDAAAIAAQCGFKLNWDYMEGRQGARANIERKGVSLTDEATWPAQHKWLFEKLDAMHRAFHARVQAIDLGSAAEI